MNSRLQKRFTRIDAAALLVFAAVWIYYIVIVRYGVCFPDESQFITTAERFVHGDRPLVDDWHLAQLSCLFLCPFYKLYVAVKGSTAGIILFLRYLFTALNAVVYWVTYLHLRKYRWLSLVTTLLFCINVPAGLFAWYYYTASIRLLMVACLLLFAEKKTPLSLMISGVLFALSVVYQPGFALMYFAFTVLVWLRFFRKKKGRAFADGFDFCLDASTWLWFSASIFVCAAALLTFVFIRSGLRNILATLPYMFLTDPEYDYSAGGSAWSVVFRKLSEAVGVYGYACLAAAILVIALSAAYACGRFRSRRSIARKTLFCAACAVWIWSCVPTFRLLSGTLPFAGIFFKIYPVTLFWLGLACYLLCERKDRRLFCFWIVSLCASLGVDLTSELSIANGAPISYVADLAFFVQLVRELREAEPVRKSAGANSLRARKAARRADASVRWATRLACGCFALWFACTLVRDNTILPMHYLQHTPARSFTAVCESGPCAGIRYPEAYRDAYEKMLADVDAFKRTQPKNLFVYGMAPELYLYAGLPYAAYNSWIWRKPSYLQRNALYWALHPERQPSCVYIPFFEAYEHPDASDFSAEDFLAQIRESFDPLCDYTAEKGQGGYILHVSGWHLKPAAIPNR